MAPAAPAKFREALEVAFRDGIQPAGSVEVFANGEDPVKVELDLAIGLNDAGMVPLPRWFRFNGVQLGVNAEEGSRPFHRIGVVRMRRVKELVLGTGSPGGTNGAVFVNVDKNTAVTVFDDLPVEREIEVLVFLV